MSSGTVGSAGGRLRHAAKSTAITSTVTSSQIIAPTAFPSDQTSFFPYGVAAPGPLTATL